MKHPYKPGDLVQMPPGTKSSAGGDYGRVMISWPRDLVWTVTKCDDHADHGPGLEATCRQLPGVVLSCWADKVVPAPAIDALGQCAL